MRFVGVGGSVVPGVIWTSVGNICFDTGPIQIIYLGYGHWLYTCTAHKYQGGITSGNVACTSLAL